MAKKKSGHKNKSLKPSFNKKRKQPNNGLTPEMQGVSKKNKTHVKSDSNDPKQNKRQSVTDSDSPVKGKKQKLNKFAGTALLKDDNCETPQVTDSSSSTLEISPNKKKQKQKPQTIDNTQNSVDSSKGIKINNKKKKTAVVKPSTVSLIPSGKKLTKKQKKRIAVRLHKQRVNDIKEKLSKGGDGVEHIICQLKEIIEENKKISDLKISISCAKQLLYFHKHSTDAITKKSDQDAKIEDKLNKRKKKSLEPLNQPNKKVKKIKKDIKVEDDGGGSDYEVERVVKVDKVTKKMNDYQTDTDDETASKIEAESDPDRGDVKSSASEDSGEDEEDGGDVDIKQDQKQPNQKNKKKINVMENLKNVGIVQKGQSRFVLFVGNIPYDATTNELKDHFSKIGEVKHVRLPMEKGSNKPRGFAYVELSDETSYQRGLSLHHTMMRDRKINVLYSQGGKKKGEGKKNAIRLKNLQLHDMRKKGVLTCTDSQKKAARKAMRKKLQPKKKSE